LNPAALPDTVADMSQNADNLNSPPIVGRRQTLRRPLHAAALLLNCLVLVSCAPEKQTETEPKTRTDKMVFDSISNYKEYTDLSPTIARALKIMAATDFNELADGKYPVDGDKLFYMVQRYDTGPLLEKAEAHRKYIDIQLMAKGEERLGVGKTKDLEPHTPYDETKDVEFFWAQKGIKYVDAKEGMFLIFWPGDAHMPGRQIGEPRKVTKVVFKVMVD